eukprot:TRINITY_DN7_c0_g1_i1.p1 TRINITY_DN7_c0_g1~~TRINITY_DN7_c0_g1_i1.p1  ORF type:complete len:483 (+),score=124.42 TRINITY_DN7_c0_g1_i1:66-1514(+)
MLSLTSYTVCTFAASAGVVVHAFSKELHFYEAMKYLFTSKANLFVLANGAAMLWVAFARLVQWCFFGRLRPTEVQVLYDKGWYAVTETLLAMTIFRTDFNLLFALLFAALLTTKLFHCLAQERVDYIEQAAALSVFTHMRTLAFICLMVSVDVAFLVHIGRNYWSDGQPSYMLLFGFEFLILASIITTTFFKYILQTINRRMNHQFENKGWYVFVLEIAAQGFQLLVYVMFFYQVMARYGLPLHIVRDVFITFVSFKDKLLAFARYRKIVAGLDRFPDATAEDFERERRCAVCQDDMTSAKKLTCGHIFHRHCLKHWMEEQQRCPLCTRPVLPTGANANVPAAAAPAAAQPQPIPQQAGAQIPQAAAAVGVNPDAAAAAAQVQQQLLMPQMMMVQGPTGPMVAVSPAQLLQQQHQQQMLAFQLQQQNMIMMQLLQTLQGIQPQQQPQDQQAPVATTATTTQPAPATETTNVADEKNVDTPAQ